jgi:hypothetical protein
MPRTLKTLATKEAKAALQSESRIATWKKYLKTAGLDAKLFSERKAWDDPPTDEEIIYDLQMLAALQAFTWMFTGAQQRAWVHLAAEMQAGKSGVMNALIRLVLQNYDHLAIRPDSIFVLTGMSDDAWRKQTRARLPKDVRPNVHHSGGLKKVREALLKLHAKDGLRNLLIILDESQVAAASGNRPNTQVYTTIRELVPPEQWAARNIRFLTVSATDPAKVMAMEGCPSSFARVVQLRTTKAYQSVESLKEAKEPKRLRSLEEFGDIGSSVKSITELKRAVASYDTPLWHILRPKMGKTEEVEAKLRAAFPEARIVAWDSKVRATAGDEEDSEATEEMKDINDLLATAPETHSFVLLKNMFYAAKTLKDTHVGVLWDRLGGSVGGDNARLQSLLGRACGYGKSKRTVVYTSLETVERYLGFWRELCRSAEAETSTDTYKASDLNRRMPGVVAVAGEDGTASVAPVLNTSNPVANSAANAVAASAGRVSVNQDNFADPEWHEFTSFADAKSFASRVREPKRDAEGYYLSATTGKVARLSYGEVKGMQGGKKTAGFCIPKEMEIGKSTHTMYVCYKNLRDKESVAFVVGKLTRIA